jgi:hypothetical protein
MSREQVASCPLAAGELPLLALARLIPETSLLELRAFAGRVGEPVRRAFLHVAQCGTCAPAALRGGEPCARGARYVERARGWRSRHAA